MKINLQGFDINSNLIDLPQPIWFSHLIDLDGTNINFQFTFLNEIPDKLTKLNVQINKQPVQTLIIDKIQKINKNKKTFFTLSASNPLCYIWQNNVPPEIYNNFSLDLFFEKYCKPFQITIKSNLKMAKLKSKTFFTSLGMSYWDCICLFFKRELNTTVFIDENKRISPKFLTKPIIVFNSNDPDLIYFNKIDDRSKLLSTIFIQQPDDPPNVFTKLVLKGSIAEKKGINRTKFFKLPKQYAQLPHRGAQVTIEKFNANHKSLEITFAKIMDPIYPGTVLVFMESGKRTELCVYSFCTGINKDGPFTHIKLYYSDLII